MRLSKLIFSIFLISSLQASSLLKVVCDRDDENIYLDGKFKTECSYNEVVKLLVSPGKHTIKIIKNNPDKSYYVFKDSIRLGDGIEKVIEVHSKIVYTKDYYYKRAYKSLKDAKIFISKYPNSNEAIKVKNYWENRYWKNCNTLNGCKDYLSEIPWKKHTQQAKSKLEKYYYQKAKNDISYAWKYLKKYPNGKYVRNIKTLLDNYYYKRCNNIDSCEAYLNKITWDKNREKKVKSKLEKLYKNYALNYHKYDIYLNKYPNGKYKNEVLEEKLYYLAKTKKDKDSFLAYLNKVPNGKYASELRKWLSNVFLLKTKIKYKGDKDYDHRYFQFYKIKCNNECLVFYTKYGKKGIFNIKNNKIEWKIEDIPYVSDYIKSLDMILSNNKVFLSNGKDLIYVDLNNSKIIWHLKFGGRTYKLKKDGNYLYVLSTMLHISKDCPAYYDHNNPVITKIDIKTGKVLSKIVLTKIHVYSVYYESMDINIENNILAISIQKKGVLLLKFDNNGNIIWQRLFKSYRVPEKLNIIKLSDGNFLINIKNGLVKFDINGNIIWKKMKLYVYGLKKLKNGNILGILYSGNIGLLVMDEKGNIIWKKFWDMDFVNIKGFDINEKNEVVIVGYNLLGGSADPWILIFKSYKATK